MEKKNTIENDGFVSIIMAAYNAEKTIGSAIQSVLSQTHPNWELLVINDCSTDNTATISETYAKQDARIRVMHNGVNLGVSKTREKGMNYANGEWIAVLDSDDIWANDKLEKQLALAQQKGAELIFTASAFVDEDGNPINWQMNVPESYTYRQLLKQNLISNSSVLVKKRLYEQHFAVGDGMHEDYAIWLGITNAGHVAYGIDEPLLIYRIGRSTKTSNKMKAAKMQWNTYRYIGLNPLFASYCMCWYAIKGLLKYRHLK